MYQGKLEIVKNEMERTGTSVLGVSELKWTGSGFFHSENHTVYYSGNENIRTRGVAVICDSEAAKSVLGFYPLNDRLMSIRLQGKPINTTIIQIYAPTSTAEEEDVEEFYDQLQFLIDKTPSQDTLLILGDFNAKVGDTEVPGLVGKFGLGEKNDSGQRLIDFCAANELVVTNTTFKQHKRRLYTWTSPNGVYRNQIDYILVKKRWRNSILCAKTRPGADCGSDHEMLIADIRVKLKKVKTPAKPKRYDLEQVPNIFSVEVSNKFALLEEAEREPEELWKEAKDIILASAADHVPGKKKTAPSPWLSQNAIDIAVERRKLKGKSSETEKQQYKKLCSDFQRQARRDKEEYYKKICDDIETEHNNGNARAMFGKIRQVSKKFSPRTSSIKNKEGEVLSDLDKVLDRWKEYTEELFEKDKGMPSCDYSDYDVPEPCILASEVRQALSDIANSKAPGGDDIPIELWKHAGEEGIRILTSLCNNIWRTAKWPADWKRSVFIPLPKKGDTMKCENHRTIALISHTSKVMLKIIQSRLKKLMEEQIPREQAGFRQGRGTRDHIANLRWIMEIAHERQKTLHLCFLDYSKAFDSVDHDLMWSYLKFLGAPPHIIAILQALYKDQEACVRVNQSETSWFGIGKGLRQGCILSPGLFNLYSEVILRNALATYDKGVRLGGLVLNNLRYADDTTVLAECQEDLKYMLLRIKDESLKAGLRLNIKKTKYMTTAVDVSNLVLHGEQVEQVRTFNFLGSMISEDGSCKHEVVRRLAIARTTMSSLQKVWKDHDISVQTKKRIVETMVFPVATYGAESWTVTAELRRRIQGFEMWCWRRMLRIPWTRKVTNRSVLETVGSPVTLDGIILHRKLSYCGHILREHRNELEKILMLGMMEGSRARGRPRTRWLDEVKAEMGYSLGQLVRVAEDSLQWRTLSRRVAKSRLRLGGNR